jgi:hypothetical protein
VNQADPEEARYLALGQRNAKAIELFERFCGNVRVEVMSGRGMLEAATGLPIAHRAFRCAYASGTVAYSMHLDDAAVEFYEQHCRGCGDRIRSGLLGENIATLADTRRAARDTQTRREAAETAERQRRQEERTARRTRKRAGEAYQSVAQIERVDRLDALGGAPDPADVEWLARTASLGP